MQSSTKPATFDFLLAWSLESVGALRFLFSSAIEFDVEQTEMGPKVGNVWCRLGRVQKARDALGDAGRGASLLLSLRLAPASSLSLLHTHFGSLSTYVDRTFDVVTRSRTQPSTLLLKPRIRAFGISLVFVSPHPARVSLSQQSRGVSSRRAGRLSRLPWSQPQRRASWHGLAWLSSSAVLQTRCPLGT